uniref:Uncharacterized protein n=1 Tax=Panagrellus redivivus TaxID=6233 RepID=A0A7E4VLC7_PANRE
MHPFYMSTNALGFALQSKNYASMDSTSNTIGSRRQCVISDMVSPASSDSWDLRGFDAMHDIVSRIITDQMGDRMQKAVIEVSRKPGCLQKTAMWMISD